jgi:SAM-dependent methyltransferase
VAGSAIRWSAIEEPFRGRFHSPREVQAPRRDAYRLLARLHRKRLRGISRRNGGPARDTDRVADIYEHEYLPSSAEFVRKRDGRRDLFLIGRRPVFVDGWFTYEYRVDLLERALALTGARRVLELGSGRGILLAMLALRRPDLRLTGIELTNEGVARSRELAADPPRELLDLCGVEQPSPEQAEALAAIEFVTGDAAAMPFADDSFDVSFSCLSLEQMPTVADRALAEMVRVTRDYCVLLEPFADANGALGMAQLQALGYFRGGLDSLRALGLEPVHFTTAIPQKVRFKTGLLVARVRRA